MPKCDFNKVIEIAFRHGCSFVNLLHIFRTPFDKSTYEGLFLLVVLQSTLMISSLFGNIHEKFPVSF